MLMDCFSSNILRSAGANLGLILWFFLVCATLSNAAADGIAPPYSNAPKASLNRIIENPETMMDIEFAPLPRKIAAVCRAAQVPCGFEESPADPIHNIDYNHDASERLGLPDRKRTYREALDAVLAKHPAYRWEFRDGVILVYPKAGKEHRRFWKPVLSRRLRHFKYSDNPSGALLFQACRDAGVMKYLKLPKVPTILPFEPLPTTGRVDIDLKDVTVRDALVAIARADGKMGWKFVYDPTKREYTFRILTWGRSTALSPYWW